MIATPVASHLSLKQACDVPSIAQIIRCGRDLDCLNNPPPLTVGCCLATSAPFRGRPGGPGSRAQPPQVPRAICSRPWPI